MKNFLPSLSKPLLTLTVWALFASNSPAQQASPEGAAKKADPQAYALLKSTRAQSQTFPADFTGFSADLVYHEESKTATGKLEFLIGSGLQIEAHDLSDEARAWLQSALGSWIMHRRGGDFDRGDGRYPLTFGPDDHHPFGRLIFLNDQLQSSYRVRDRVITEVNRTMGPEKFTITILETTPADPGKHLPRHFVVNYFDARTGAVLRSEAFTDQYVKVDQVWLPASRRIVRAEGGKITTRLIELRNHRLKPAQTSNRSGGKTIDEQGSTLGRGILLLAHGGKQAWNDEVNLLAAQVNRTVPVEVAFGMANKRNIQGAIDRLIARGVSEIVAVPLFVSSHSSVITATQYLLGLRAEAPPELARYARMDHNHGAHQTGQANAPASDPTLPVKLPVPIRMSGALDRHPLVADILLARARSISREPAREVIVVVAHGPVSDEENAKWLADMQALVELMKKASDFRRIEYLTLRDDAPQPIRSQATAELRSVVEGATREGNRALIVPLLVSYGGIEEGIKQRLAGLNFTMCEQALLPDERLARWILLAATGAAEN